MEKRAISRRKRRSRHARPVWAAAVIVICLISVAFYLAGHGSREPSDAEEPDHFRLADVDPEQKTEPDEPENTPLEDAPWNLILVNRWNPLPEDHSITTTQLRNGQAVDERCYDDLQAMLDACRADGLSPVVCSSYRTWEKQETLYNNLVNKLIAQGYSEGDAKEAAGKEIAVPGTSEHQSGLAVDIVDLSYQILDSAQEDTPVQKWLIEHCWEYGFILRYPNGKSELTGIIYEPWHYRYVGKEAAKEITEAGLCLEEYLAGNT